MVSRPPAAALVIDEGQRVTLEGLAASQAAPRRQVQRAKALLLAADGVANSHIAQRIGVSVGTVRAWRDRFAEDGLAKLGQVRRGRVNSLRALTATVPQPVLGEHPVYHFGELLSIARLEAL